jgi:metallo-beta-lactamase class B
VMVVRPAPHRDTFSFMILRASLLALSFTCALLAQAPAAPATQKGAAAPRDWNRAAAPHKVIGNIYSIGTGEISTFLITSPQGHILINSDFETTVPSLRANIEKLGFKLTDVKIILGSHAHGDHMEADAMLKELTGARVMAMDRDVPALQAMKPGGKAHPIDRIFKDGDTVELGPNKLTAHLTAGHTKGCTSFSWQVAEAGKTYNVVMVCSVGWNPGYVLVNNKDYPSIADDYRASFAKLRTLPCDIFLGPHGNFYALEGKYAKLNAKPAPTANPYIDPAGYKAYIDDKERSFNEEFNRQKALAK